jgi:hypothetical protein
MGVRTVVVGEFLDGDNVSSNMPFSLPHAVSQERTQKIMTNTNTKIPIAARHSIRPAGIARAL